MAVINTRKRGTKWEYRFESAKIDGKRKHISKSGFRTKKEALEAGAKALAEYNQSGLTFIPKDISMHDYLDYWYEEHCVLNLKYNTLVNYKAHIEKFLKPAFGKYKLSALSSASIQSFINDLKKQGYSKSHTIGIKSTLSASLEYAVEPLNFITFNPCKNVKNPKFEKQPEKRFVISNDDFNRIINRFPPDNIFYTPLMIGYHAGLRISETFALTWEDIDFENKTISINKSTVKRYKDTKNQKEPLGWFFQTTKTKSSVRTIKIGDTLIKALKLARKKQIENKLFYGEFYTRIYQENKIDEKSNEIKKIIEINSNVDISLDEIEMICVKENGEYVSTDSFKYCSRVINHSLKIDFNYHSLRHTHATILIESGANIKDVQTRLGHNSIETTLDIYTHNTERMENETINIFEQAIK
ncbi:site-specific integrase [Peptostreptococcus faecalis]|uniref:site-specific integrase n=1 Tax=Peptostreptococcus faecalis TaxID=2045015 RepID=UPI000C7DB7F4|nr:site-specific integrase [Peptostreptococcus faecalis]